MTIRTTILNDCPALQSVLLETGLFPPELLPDMLQDTKEPSLWLTCETAGQAIGFCYARAEPLTDGTWNMLAIAIDPQIQGTGSGKALVGHLESTLAAEGARILIVDTSGSEDFSQTRSFYRHLGYVEEARIRDYWTAGDDKITFWKTLT